MGTLYARREPSTDPAFLAYFKASGAKPDPVKHFDVVIYRDSAARERIGRHLWHHAAKPDRRHRYTMHNCARYRLEWLDN